MNIWIVGGLLAVGLLALISLAFVLIGEQRTHKANGSQPLDPLRMERDGFPTQELSRDTVPVSQHLPVTPHAEEQALPIMNGQLRELSAELRMTYQQTQALEQHLRVLNDMIERLERSREKRANLNVSHLKDGLSKL